MALQLADLPLVPDWPPGFPPSYTGVYDFSRHDASELDGLIENALRHFGLIPRALFENLVFGVPFGAQRRLLIVPDDLTAHSEWWSNWRCCPYCEMCGFPVDPNKRRHYYEVAEHNGREKNIAHWSCYCAWALDDKDEIKPRELAQHVNVERNNALSRLAEW